MTPGQRMELLGADVVAAVREEGRRAAEDYPPGQDVIEALRPILTSRRPRAHHPKPTRTPLAA